MCRWIVWAIVLMSGCYPSFSETPVQAPVSVIPIGIPAASGTAAEINGFIVACRQNLENARRNAHDLHRSAHKAGVVGSIVTLLTGGMSGASGGVAGFQESKGWGVTSIITGGAALGSGVVTIILVNKEGIKSAEEDQTKRLVAWSAILRARKEYTPAVLAFNEASQEVATKTETLKEAQKLPDADASKVQRVAQAQKELDVAIVNQSAKRTALGAAIKDFYGAAADCGLAAGPPGYN